MKILLTILFNIVYLFISIARANLLNELTLTEQQQLLSKNLIVHTKKTPQGPWPSVTIYALIDCSPFEAMAIYAAYDYQKDFVPELLESTPIKSITPTDVHVRYTRKMPWPLANNQYTTGNRIFENDKQYRLEWYLVESKSAVDTKGYIIFTPFNDLTLIKYENLIVPSSFFASLLKGRMVKDIQHTLEKIILYIEETKTNKDTKLIELQLRISQALSGKTVY